MPSTGQQGGRGLPRGRPWSTTIGRVVGAGCALALLGASVTACAGVTGHAVVKPGEVAAYQSELSVSRVAQTNTAAAEVCRVATTSMVLMLRGYNAFVQRLNTVQSYDKLGDLDDKARASLIAGGDMVRAELTAAVPAELGATTQTFLDSTARLGDVIARREMTGLNGAAAAWTRDRRALLDACATYLPAPPATPASPTPSSPGTSTAPAPGSSTAPAPGTSTAAPTPGTSTAPTPGG
ncbi:MULTISPECIES: hypothetical protein [unclassified Gordonia (in: high G+C Gram-positive bacteria)]